MSHPSHTSVARTLFPTDQHAAIYEPPAWARASHDPAALEREAEPICFEPLAEEAAAPEQDESHLLRALMTFLPIAMACWTGVGILAAWLAGRL